MVGMIKWAGLFCLAALAPAILAQEGPLVRVNTRLVEVDVVVHTKGETVADLKQDDFTVLDKGKPQKIAAFNVVSSRTSAAKANPLPPGAVSNRINTAGEEPAGTTVILYDTLNTAVGDQSWARKELFKYLSTLQSGDHFALYSLGKTLAVIQDFTDNPERLIAAARRANPAASIDQTTDDLAADLLASPPPSTGDAIADAMYVDSVKDMQDASLVNRAIITGKVLEMIARHLQGLPGRKKLVWISSSFPAQTTDVRSHNGHDTLEQKEFSREIGAAVRALNDANVAVYPIDPRDPYNAGMFAPGIDSMNLFAGGTGGRAFYNISDLSSAMKTAVNDNEITYAMGFYPVDIKLDGSYHSLSVKVARKGMDLRYRKGYYATDLSQPTEQQGKESLQEIFATPLKATRIGMTARLNPDLRQAGAYELVVNFNLQEVHLERGKGQLGGADQVRHLFPRGIQAQRNRGSDQDHSYGEAAARNAGQRLHRAAADQRGKPQRRSARGDSGSRHRRRRFGEAAIGRGGAIES